MIVSVTNPHSVGYLVQLGVTVIALVVIYGLPLVLIIRLIKYLGTSSKEQQRMRLEITKIADEVQKMRQEMQNISPKQQNPMM